MSNLAQFEGVVNADGVNPIMGMFWLPYERIEAIIVSGVNSRIFAEGCKRYSVDMDTAEAVRKEWYLWLGRYIAYTYQSSDAPKLIATFPIGAGKLYLKLTAVGSLYVDSESPTLITGQLKSGHEFSVSGAKSQLIAAMDEWLNFTLQQGSLKQPFRY